MIGWLLNTNHKECARIQFQLKVRYYPKILFEELMKQECHKFSYN